MKIFMFFERLFVHRRAHNLRNVSQLCLGYVSSPAWLCCLFIPLPEAPPQLLPLPCNSSCGVGDSLPSDAASASGEPSPLSIKQGLLNEFHVSDLFVHTRQFNSIKAQMCLALHCEHCGQSAPWAEGDIICLATLGSAREGSYLCQQRCGCRRVMSK